MVESLTTLGQTLEFYFQIIGIACFLGLLVAIYFIYRLSR